MRRTVLIAAGLVAAGVAISAGSFVAQANPAAHHRPPAGRHTEILSLMSTSTNPKPSVIATGYFTAGGTDTVGTKVDILKFGKSTLMFRHGRGGHHTRLLNKKTCMYLATTTGTYTLGGGTGAYSGISGRGTYQLRYSAILRRKHGACNFKSRHYANQETILATGSVTRPAEA